jgi:hypothetical protein
MIFAAVYILLSACESYLAVIAKSSTDRALFVAAAVVFGLGGVMTMFVAATKRIVKAIEANKPSA